MAGFLDRLKKGADRAAFEAERLRRIASVRSEINALKGRVKQNRKSLGIRALELFDADHLTQPELLEICEQIAALRQQVAEKEAKIEAIRQETLPEEPEPALYGHICPRCKIRLPDEAQFCPRCGGPAADVLPPTLPEAPAGRLCSNCGERLVEGAVSCPSCGTKVKAPAPAPVRVCASCGTPLVEGAVFCPECGTRVEEPEPVAAVEGEAEAGEGLEEAAEPVGEGESPTESTDE